MPTALASLLLVSLVAGTVISTWKWIEASASAERARVAADESNRSAKRSGDVLNVVVDAFEAVNPAEGADASMSARDVLVEAQKSLDSSDLDERGRMQLLTILSQTFQGVGEFERAIQTGESAVELYRQQLGESHPTTLVATNNLVNAYISAGELQKAAALGEMCLTHSQGHSDDPKATVQTIQNLGAVYEQLGEYDRALELKEQALQHCRDRLDSDSEETLSAMHELAYSYETKNRFEDALPLYEETLEKFCELFGEDHPNSLTVRNNLAGTLESMGRVDEALEMYRDVLDRRTTKLGKDHPDTLGAMSNVGYTLASAGRIEEALPIFQTAVDGLREKAGKDHPNTLNSAFTLAVYTEKSGRLKNALPLYEETLEGQRRTLGLQHPLALTTTSTLASAYLQLDRVDDALPLLKELVKQTEAAAGEHPATVAAKQQWAEALQAAGDLEAAEALLRECLEFSLAQQPESWMTFDCQSQLGGVLLETGNSDDAAELLQRGYAGLKAAETISAQNPVKWFRPEPLAKAVRTRALRRLIALAEAMEDAEASQRWTATLEAL